MLSNPGAVPSNAKPLDPEESNRKCFRCQAFKPLRAHHCSICNRCIVKMDHHCPWVNNCVGLTNQKFFILFVFYVMACAVYALTVIFAWLIACGPAWTPLTSSRLRSQRSSPQEEPPADPSVEGCRSSVAGGGVAAVVGVVICAIFFGLFTFCMLMDQLNAASENRTAIDRLKGARAARDARDRTWDNLAEVFGGKPGAGFRWHWLLPTRISYPDPEALTGYGFRDPVRLPPRHREELEMV